MTGDTEQAQGGSLLPPFPWYGGKMKIASYIWQRLGQVSVYVEPFAGALSVLLARPDTPIHENVNDMDGWLANFWRAVKWAPGDVAEWADWPKSEIDLHARFDWFLRQDENDLVAQLEADPEYCDPKAAGWWVWGQCASIMGNWLTPGGQRSRPHMHAHGLSRRVDIRGWIAALSLRLRHVTVMCGDWKRLTGIAGWKRRGIKGFFLDPPYICRRNGRRAIYRVDSKTVAAEVAEWAVEAGVRKDVRIALCGIAGDYDMPNNWTALRWSTHGGMTHLSEGRSGNYDLEVVWCSPHCLSAPQLELFEEPLFESASGLCPT